MIWIIGLKGFIQIFIFEHFLTFIIKVSKIISGANFLLNSKSFATAFTINFFALKFGRCLSIKKDSMSLYPCPTTPGFVDRVNYTA